MNTEDVQMMEEMILKTRQMSKANETYVTKGQVKFCGDPLTCFICSEIPTFPAITKCCKHIACMKCIIEWIIKNQPNCPICRKVFKNWRDIPGWLIESDTDAKHWEWVMKELTP